MLRAASAAVLAIVLPAAFQDPLVITRSPDQSGSATRPASRPAESRPAPRTVREKDRVFEVYGEGVKQKTAVALAEVVQKIDEYSGKTVRVEGKVESVCERKGCWMWVANGGARVFVRFKDYGFFVPTDCNGREVILEGVPGKTVHSVERAQHYAEDRGDFEGAKKITKPQEVTEILATGVLLAPQKVDEHKGKQ